MSTIIIIIINMLINKMHESSYFCHHIENINTSDGTDTIYSKFIPGIINEDTVIFTIFNGPKSIGQNIFDLTSYNTKRQNCLLYILGGINITFWGLHFI